MPAPPPNASLDVTDLACRVKLKRCFPNWTSADAEIALVLERSGKELVSYRCPVCHYIHLTKSRRERARQLEAAATTVAPTGREGRNRGERHSRGHRRLHKLRPGERAELQRARESTDGDE